MEELRVAEGKCNRWKVKLAALVYWLDTGKVKRWAEGVPQIANWSDSLEVVVREFRCRNKIGLVVDILHLRSLCLIQVE